MNTPAPNPEAADTTAPVARAANARGDVAVIGDLMPYLRPYWGRILVALGLVAGAKVLNMFVPYALKRIVDGLNVQPSLLLLPVGLLLAYGASRIGVTLFTELKQVVFARVMARTSRQVTLKVFQHLHGLSLLFLLARWSGGVACVLVCLYDWRFAAITLITLFAYGLWTISITEWRTRYYRASVEADTRANER